MKRVFARRNFVILHDDGRVHYPFTRFLTDKFTNPHTRELVSQSLRVLYRFCTAQGIELAARALNGRCLSHDEGRRLAELCYRPMAEVEAMSDRSVALITSARAGKAPRDLPSTVQPNSAKMRLNHIAQYLEHYHIAFLEPNIRSPSAREQLMLNYDRTTSQLRRIVRGTKQNHHLAIQSLPSDKFLAIMEAVFLRPDECFQSGMGKPSRTILRDRAMVLLACEGLRPGTLGNILIRDFRPHSGHLVIKDNRAQRKERLTTNTPTLKMGDTTHVTNASETMISLWPFTVQAIQEYVEQERSAVLMKKLTNRSNGFLFLNEHGAPIRHRSTITAMFNGLGKRLDALGLLDVGADPYFADQKKYSFYGYVLRHSAASYFLAAKSSEIARERGTAGRAGYAHVPDRVKDLMKIRFGWTRNSSMPELYAARALSDDANIRLLEIHQSLLDAAKARKQQMEIAHVV